ncbi:hypothetical protein P389DRAFT_194421 [Cystobasidium minutum MCA 4210]|uniref:uncharacterized protein n=1 Tax=Cystobasidium minutum MCA 4210 TaxID=1397322 RepID=UPI0034CF72B4|eukprot:jgi/Rhomi1/194421/gm1.2635_g
MADDAFKKRLENFESAHRPAEAVDTNKINFYTAGLQKKSKREREKEAAEAKRLKEEEDAAKAYREFVASFDDPSESSGVRSHKTFVRAGGSGSPSISPPAGPSGSSHGFRSVGPSTSRPSPHSNPLAPPSGPRAFNGRAAPSQACLLSSMSPELSAMLT